MKHTHIHLLALCGLLMASWAISRASANETFVDAGGGSVSPRGIEETEVELVSETLRIYLNSKGFTADASFVLLSRGPPVSHRVGFPKFDFGTKLVGHLRDFGTWVNGQPVQTVEFPSEPQEHPFIRSWFVSEISFPEGQLTTVRVRYSSNYGRDHLTRTVEYFYGTGRTWRGSVGQIRVQVFNRNDMWVDSCSFDGDVTVAFLSVDQNNFELITADIEPEANSILRLVLERVPWWLSDTPSTSEQDWIFDKILVEEQYLRLLTLKQLRIFRNAFYARRGFDFCGGELGQFFSQFRWYRPHVTVDTGLLTSIEQENVNRIVAEEERRRAFLLN